MFLIILLSEKLLIKMHGYSYAIDFLRFLFFSF